MTDINRRNMITLLGAAPFAGVLIGQAQTPVSSSKFQNISSRQRIRQRYFPNLVLTTHEGRKVRFYDDLIKDKIVILNFMYVKCEGICMPLTMNLRRVQDLFGKRMGRDIFIYSFTLKPQEDTVASLRHYAHMHHVRPGWTFLTGSVADMELVRRKLEFVDPDPELDKDKSTHVGVIKYGNEPLERWGGCPGMSKAAWIVKSVSWVDWPNSLKKNGGAFESSSIERGKDNSSGGRNVPGHRDAGAPRIRWRNQHSRRARFR
jgi:protein SCO1/2